MIESLTSYKNGNYNVTILNDGTKIRENDLDYFSPSLPESIDLTVTYQCEVGCPYCYQGCTKDGKNCDFNSEIVESFHPGLEVAIGASGGVFQDENIDKFNCFLSKLKNKGCIVNITVNQIHFIKYNDIIKEWIKNKVVYGVGVSISEPLLQFNFISSILRHFESEDIHNNIVFHTIAGIHTVEDINKLCSIYTKSKPKILILGYKSVGRGIKYKESFDKVICDNIKSLENELNHICKKVDCLSFDNLAVEQLGIKNKVDKDVWNTYFLGEDGKYSFYIDLVKGTFSKNSLCEETYDIKDFKTLKEMFSFLKSY